MSLAVIIPTISGREQSLQRTIDAYEDTLASVSHRIIVVRDLPSWPAACNEGYRRAHSAEYYHFGADDLVPLSGWWVGALSVLIDDELPAAAVFDYIRRGRFYNAEDGQDGDEVEFTRVPTLSRSQYERIGPWPEIPYCADVWVSEKGRSVGIKTRIRYSYAFVHHWNQIGRLDSEENMRASYEELDRLRAEMTGWELQPSS